MIKAIVFDCFGVLVGRGFEETYRLAGGDPRRDRDFIDDLLGQANLGLISQAAFYKGITLRLGITAERWQAAIETAEQPNVALLEYIEQLHKTYKTAVLSNANRGVVTRRIGSDWAAKCFNEIVVSAEVGKVKPDPEIYLMTAERLGIAASDCLFTDDKEYFCQAARGVGMQSLMYNDFAQFKTQLAPLLAAA